jgi:hypothetical protein
LSAVGAAFSAGAAGVSARTVELNIKTPASAAVANPRANPRPIAISFFLFASNPGRKIIGRDLRGLAHDPEKWEPVFRKITLKQTDAIMIRSNQSDHGLARTDLISP